MIHTLRREIENAFGREVLAAAAIDKEGMVCEITVAARGSESEVPALMEFMEKGDVVIHNHPSGVLRPSAADLRIAARLGNFGIGFFIIDNRVENLYAVAEPVT
ncbi:MAG: JAB domain-containing protein, partial [Spirochaetota bacterium]